MKIWFNQALAGEVSTNDDCDKDCAPPEGPLQHYSVQLSNNDDSYFNACKDHAFPAQESSCSSHKESIQRAASLYIQPLSSGQTLVCNPTGSGNIAVLDEQALELLEQMRTPTYLYEVLSTHPGEQAEAIRSAIATFYNLGFLSDEQRPPDLAGTSSTLSAWLHVTNACNLSCNYCYIGKTSEHMSEDTSRRAIDAIFRSAVKHRYKQVRLRYAGGEASLRAENVLSIHEYALAQAQQHGLDFHAFILSNGVFLSPHIIAAFKAHSIGVTLSLDGIGQEHDQQRPFINGRSSFKFVDRTITRLLAHELAPHITITVSHRNLTGLPTLMEYLLERNLSFSFNYYRANVYSMQQSDLQFEEEEMIAAMRSAFRVIEKHLPQRSLLNSLLDKASIQSTHQHACSVGRNYIVIDQRGGVAKCHADIQSTVTTIDAPDPLQQIREDTRGLQVYAADEKEGCRTCNWRYWCSGGCPTLTYQLTGRTDVKSPNCNIYKALFPDVLHLEALRLLTYTSPIAF